MLEIIMKRCEGVIFRLNASFIFDRPVPTVGCGVSSSPGKSSVNKVPISPFLSANYFNFVYSGSLSEELGAVE